jgi:hypothetical protein
MRGEDTSHVASAVTQALDIELHDGETTPARTATHSMGDAIGCPSRQTSSGPRTRNSGIQPSGGPH